METSCRIVLSLTVFFSQFAMAEKDWFLELNLGQSSPDGASAPLNTHIDTPGAIGSGCLGFNCVQAIKIDSATLDGNTFGKLAIGKQFNRNWGIKLAYVDAGSSEGDIKSPPAGVGRVMTTVDISGFNLAGTYSYPVYGQFSLFASIGMFAYELDTTDTYTAAQDFGGFVFVTDFVFPDQPFGDIVTEIANTRQQSGTEFNYAVGLIYTLSEVIDLKLEYQAFRDIGNLNIDVGSIGIIWRF